MNASLPPTDPRPGRERLPRHFRLQRALFVVLWLAVIGLVAALSERYAMVTDWTENARHTLSEASRAVLDTMPEPITVTAFVTDSRQLREAIRQLLERYQREHAQLNVSFSNPELEPRRAAEAGVEGNGVLRIQYLGRSELVSTLSEQSVSNALNRLARAQARWIAFLSGRGERDMLGDARRDLGQFGRHLESSGFRLRPLELGDASTAVPNNVTLLVVLEPRDGLPASALAALNAHLESGGNLLWLSDARHHASLAPLERALGVAREVGMLVDPNSRLRGQSTPEFIRITGYAEHPVTDAIDGAIVLPTATSLRWSAPPNWQVKGLAASSLTSWRETGDQNAAVGFDEGRDSPGPLDVVVALERASARDRGQRVLVVGDADFLSNAYLGLDRNRALGDAAISWLVHDDAMIDVPAFAATDLAFEPSNGARAAIALAAPIVLPLIVFAAGAWRWRRRRLS